MERANELNITFDEFAEEVLQRQIPDETMITEKTAMDNLGLQYEESDYTNRHNLQIVLAPLTAKEIWNCNARIEEEIPRSNNLLEASHQALQV